jgi:hypothetical protein
MAHVRLEDWLVLDIFDLGVVGVPFAEIGRYFDISPGRASDIFWGRTYRDVTADRISDILRGDASYGTAPAGNVDLVVEAWLDAEPSARPEPWTRCRCRERQGAAR